MSVLAIILALLLIMLLLGGAHRGVVHGPWNLLWLVVIVLVVFALFEGVG